MRERLIAIIKDSLFKHIDKSCNLAENIADDLLENGFVALPCRILDAVYLISLDKEIIEYIVTRVSLYPNGWFVDICDGEQTFSIAVKKIHFTREEAEAKLKGETK